MKKLIIILSFLILLSFGVFAFNPDKYVFDLDQKKIFKKKDINQNYTYEHQLCDNKGCLDIISGEGITNKDILLLNDDELKQYKKEYK